MTMDQLDTMAREASDDLRRQVDAISTEAALADLHRRAGRSGHRARRAASGRRALLAVAAIIVVVAAVGLAVIRLSGDDPERIGTATSVPIDPTTYGPLLGTLHGIDAPALTAKVYGPTALEDRSKVAVQITGGIPNQMYLVSQCAVGDANYNPAANCTYSRELTLDASGSAVEEFEVWSVFDGMGFPFRNDCREVACELQVGAVFGEQQPDEGVPGTQFAVQPDPARALADSPWIPIAFAPDAGAPPLPAITAAFLERTSGGARVRIEGHDLAPGRTSVMVDGYFEPRTGLLTHAGGVGATEISKVEVAADGTLSAEVTLPDAITELGEHTVNGVVQDPEIVACGVGTSYCTIQVRPAELTSEDGARRPLTAQPIPYPEG